MEIIATILFCILILNLAGFYLGPKLLNEFFGKEDEWAEIIDNDKNEK